jgi:beta-galactosidase
VGAFGRAAVDAGLQVGFVNDRQLPDAGELVRRYPVLVVPGLIAASDPTLETLVEYARLGGRLVIGPRTGYGDDEGRMRPVRAPAIVGPAAGIGYREFAALAEPIEVERDGEVVGTAHGWVDGLEPDGADVVLGYRHPLFGRWAAVTRREVGLGTITTVGTLLDRATLAFVMTDAAAHGSGRDADRMSANPGAPAILAARPASVTAHSLLGAQGRVWVVHNWSPQGRTIRIAADAASVLDGAVHRAGTEVELAPWDVRVWREALPVIASSALPPESSGKG